jgi:hypothetical protein
MIDGFFRIAFTGTAGSGFGMLVFHSGKIAGADMTGATFDGEYTEDSTTHEVSYQTTMALPAGVVPVQTGIPLAAPATIPLSGKFRQEDVETGKPVLLQTPLGPVNIIFSKIRDFP